jgi:RimJ/RimL family protein N-acetyltransferase
MRMPPLETERLLIRPFVLADLDAIHQILDLDLAGGQSRAERAGWLEWTMMNYDELVKLMQPPLGDRAIVLKGSEQLIGACGLAPCLLPFGLLPSFSSHPANPATARNSLEIGLYYALSPAQWGQGFATEAATALIDYVFKELNLKRIVATTTYDNAHSMRVMQRVGMRIEKNAYPEPEWLQVVGTLDNPL